MESDVRDLYTSLLDAWNRRSASDYAALFAEGATVIGFDGSIMSGPEIEVQLGAIFSDHPTARYVARVREVRLLASGAVAVLRAMVGMVPPDAEHLNPDVNAHQVMVAEQAAGSWRVVSFVNTPAQYHGRPELAEAHTDELQPLVADL